MYNFFKKFYFPYIFLREELMHEATIYRNSLTKNTIQLLNLTPSY
jgi:hypothetical protein